MSTKINSLLVAILTLTFMGCSQVQKQSAEEVLKDPEMQDDIMEAISNDQQMMMNMMDHMQKNDQAMQMMAGKKGMMQRMMGNRQMMKSMLMQDSTVSNMMMSNMMEMMEQDSIFCNRISNRMMGNRHMMNTMMDMMRQKGMRMGEGKEQERMQTHRHGDMR